MERTKLDTGMICSSSLQSLIECGYETYYEVEIKPLEVVLSFSFKTGIICLSFLFNLLINIIVTAQATNSLNLYRGGNPSTIEQLLRMQRSSVVNELKQHFGVDDISELAVKLSMA